MEQRRAVDERGVHGLQDWRVDRLDDRLRVVVDARLVRHGGRDVLDDVRHVVVGGEVD